MYGAITDNAYFETSVKHYLLDDRIKHFGVAIDMDYVYGQLTHVYHSPLLETFNLIKPECESAGVKYIGDEGNITEAEYWPNDKIIEAWKKLIYS